MESSSVFFCTVSAAHRAGKAALKQFMAKNFPRRIPSAMDAFFGLGYPKTSVR
jgi:hypothetical protein